jgi:hypothetical protein
LTLRTLLAYLDDTLEPAETRLIGQKVAESPAAQELIARIKEVVRRRRLSTPPVTGPGDKADANTIAEYIDNVLPPEQLAEVEELCLGSDVHLAEIAACHQILTVVLSEPVLVPPTAKRRMYGLVRGREAIPYRKATTSAVADAPVSDEPDVTDETLLLGLPLYRRQGPWFRRLVPLLGVLLLCVALVAAIALSLGDVWPRRPSSQTVVANSEETTKTAAAVPTAVAVVEKGKSAGPVSKANTPAREEGQARLAADHAGKDADVPAAKKKEAAPEKHDAIARPAAGIDTAAKTGKSGPVEVGTYAASGDQPSVLVQRHSAAEPWKRARNGSRVSSGDSLASLPGYQSEVAFNNGLKLLLWGHLPSAVDFPTMESSVSLNNAADADVDLTLHAGRIVISSSRGESAHVRIRFLKEVWDVSLEEPGAEAYLELWHRYDPGVAFKDPVGPHTSAAFIVMKGEALLKIGYDAFRMRQPPGRAGYFWDSMGAVELKPQNMNAIPAWLSRRPPQDKEGLALIALEKRLEPAEPISAALDNQVRDNDLRIRDLAILSLGAVDDLPALLDALANDRYQDVRVTAINTLRNWMARDGEQELKVESAMEKTWGKGQAAIGMELLHAYGPDRLSDPGLWESLIAYLTNDNLAIRELANLQLISIRPDIAQTIPAYDLAGGAEQRQLAYREWKRRIPDGKLPPAPATPQDQKKSQDQKKKK